MTRRVLIVDPDDQYRRVLFNAACDVGVLATVRSTFEDARKVIATTPIDALVTSSKLGTFNGIHLVYLLRQAREAALCIVYGDDPGIASDAQHAGAFWERPQFLPYTLAQYLSKPLPNTDRRDAHRIDRRITFRGGRRASDRPELHAAVSSLPRT